jgi:hypothetical protein
MSKTKDEECLDACTEATKLDAEADDLPLGSPEKVGVTWPYFHTPIQLVNTFYTGGKMAPSRGEI